VRSLVNPRRIGPSILDHCTKEWRRRESKASEHFGRGHERSEENAVLTLCPNRFRAPAFVDFGSPRERFRVLMYQCTKRG
jgi:hypothetical protein